MDGETLQKFPYELCRRVILHYLGAEHATQYSYAKKQLHDRCAQEMARAVETEQESYCGIKEFSSSDDINCISIKL